MNGSFLWLSSACSQPTFPPTNVSKGINSSTDFPVIARFPQGMILNSWLFSVLSSLSIGELNLHCFQYNIDTDDIQLYLSVPNFSLSSSPTSPVAHLLSWLGCLITTLKSPGSPLPFHYLVINPSPFCPPCSEHHQIVQLFPL